MGKLSDKDWIDLNVTGKDTRVQEITKELLKNRTEVEECVIKDKPNIK